MTWSTIFNRYKSRGLDASDAAFRADQWEKRQYPNRWSECSSTHCERSEECRSPNECCASLKNLRSKHITISADGDPHQCLTPISCPEE